MALTYEQRVVRQSHIGSSDAASILGLDGFGRGPRDVYYDKTEEVLEEEKDNKSFVAGNFLEEAICEYAAHELGQKIERSVFLVSSGRDEGVCAANLDAVIPSTPTEAIEAKYSGQSDEWGDEGSDQVPERVLIQCQHQMYVGGFERIWVPAMVVDFAASFRLYCVPRNEELIETLVDEELRFWNDHVLPRVPPEPGYAPLDVAKIRRRVEGVSVDLDDAALQLVNEFELAKQVSSAAEKSKKELQARVIDLLGTADGATLPDGRAITYRLQNSAPKCDRAQLRALHPDIYSDFFISGQHRTLRIKKGAK